AESFVGRISVARVYDRAESFVGRISVARVYDRAN
ncbi:MAG: hypothetical protein ACI9IQ_001658, partial [Cyclobacteriaceae bacterium]